MTKKQRLIQRGIDPLLYAAWSNMKQRCNNPRHEYYSDYGGRGITYDPDWETFAGFAKDMGPHPGKGYTLERERNHEGYRRGNCCWATPEAQANNRRDAKNRKLSAALYTQIVSEPGTCRQLGTKYGVTPALISRIKRQGATL